MSEDKIESNDLQVKADNPTQELCDLKAEAKVSSDLKSKKFFAYLISVIVSLGGFLTVYMTTKDASSYEKFLNFMLWSLVAYIGGNSAERLTDKLGK